MHIFRTITLVIFFLLIFYIAGPRIEVNDDVKAPELPASLDAYVQDVENYPDIKPNNEKKIVWANASRQKTEFSIIYLHGFSASRLEIWPVVDKIAEQLGANLFYTRLAGHGRYSIDATAKVTVEAWFRDALEALEIGKRLGNRVIVMSSSTGGTLATWLAAQRPDDIEAMVMLSPNFQPRDINSEWIVRPWGKLITRLAEGKTRQWDSDPSVNQAWTNQYYTDFIFPMMALVDHVRDIALQKLDMPILIFYSQYDKVVNPEAIKHAFSQWGSSFKRLIKVLDVEDKDNHVLAGNLKSPKNNQFIISRTVQFIHLVK